MATALLSMGGFMLMPFTSAFIVNNVHISQKELPLIFLFTGISSIIIMPIVGRMTDQFDKFKVFTVVSVLATVMVIIYTNLTPVPLWLVIVVNMILFMGIMSRIIPATALNSAIPDTADRGAYMSVNSSLQQLAGGLAALFAGLRWNTVPICTPSTICFSMPHIHGRIWMRCWQRRRRGLRRSASAISPEAKPMRRPQPLF
jgi:predicted MFS family arabinose efflux permease